MKLSTLAICLLLACSNLAYSADSTADLQIFQEPVTTEHTVSIQGKSIAYTATAGHLTLTQEDGTIRAKVFFVAYTKKGEKDPTKRPLTFSFNGGPGSSSVWLHLGVLGPRRVLMNDDGTTLPPPYELVDNDYSWLDMTDLVFIDPVSTGYSRAADPETANKEFHGYRQDIESVGAFIQRYVSDNKRWRSPKHLVGESYGTTRAAGLSEHLQSRYGMYLNGVILVSAVLNFQTIRFNEGNDLPYVMFLPTYTATAHYHQQLSDRANAENLDTLLRYSREFAEGDYTKRLMMGDRLSDRDKASFEYDARQWMGVSYQYAERSNFRLNIHKYCAELLRDSAKVIGRFDSRYTGPSTNQLSEWMGTDPSHHPTIAGCFGTCINDYLTRELNVSTTLPYEVLTGRVHPWDFGNAENQYLNVAPALRDAMVMNPDLKVWILNGYYDLATPFFATEYTINHMDLPSSLRPNITMSYYEAGHMMYLVKTELEKMRQGAEEFYQ